MPEVRVVQRERTVAKTQASYFYDANEHPSHFSSRQPEHLFQRAQGSGLQSTGASLHRRGPTCLPVLSEGGGCCDPHRHQEQREAAVVCMGERPVLW